MTEDKADLLRYLQLAREALLWKLDGLSEHDVRRPMTPTGTNLLGLVKHVASVESGYLGAVFGRPFPEPVPAHEPGAEPNADMWATAEESREDVVGFYRRVWAHSDATVEALPLDAPGHVPRWPAERAGVTLHRVLVHLVAETQRHAGHADIVRELLDGAAGMRADNGNLPDVDAAWWAQYRDRLERGAGGRGRAVTLTRFEPPAAAGSTVVAGREQGLRRLLVAAGRLPTGDRARTSDAELQSVLGRLAHDL